MSTQTQMPRVPSDFSERTPEILTINRGTELARFFTTEFEPIYFDRGVEGRFNAPDASFGVLYAAPDNLGAFAETFLRTTGRRLIDPALVKRKSLVTLAADRELRFFHFDAQHLAPLGATAAVSHSSPPYSGSHLWAQAMHDHPWSADGIAYSSRHDPSQLCLAIFDRASDAVEETERLSDLDCDLFWNMCVHYRLGIPPS